MPHPARLLLPAEVHRDDVRTVLDRLAQRMIVLGLLVALRAGFLDLRLELEREIDSGIDEAGDGGKGDDQPRRRLVEREADLEPVLADLEVPEAVLDDDGHLVREAFGQVARYVDARRMGLERDVEMVLAGQDAAALHFSQ